jgi:hypothetical protein
MWGHFDEISTECHLAAWQRTVADFAGMLSVVTVHTLFYLTLTLLLGVLVDNRFLLAALWQMNRVEF